MAKSPLSNLSAVVIDANVLVAIAAKELDTYAVALAQMRAYSRHQLPVFAPGVIVAEALYALCQKLQKGILTPAQHQHIIQRLRVGLTSILPPPGGDAALAERAEEIRGSYGCSRSADGIYIALAEQLAQAGAAELVTFDADLQRQAAAAAPSVTVRLLVSP